MVLDAESDAKVENREMGIYLKMSCRNIRGYRKLMSLAWVVQTTN